MFFIYLYVCVYVCVYVCMCVCMCVCIYVYVFIDFALAWGPSVMCVKLCPTGSIIQCTLVEFTCAC